VCVCVCVCVCVTWSIYTGMGSFGLSYAEMPNTSDYCLTGALGRLFYAFVYGRMPFLKYSHFMDLKLVVLLKRTLLWVMLRSTLSYLCPKSFWCGPHPYTYVL